MIDPPVFNISLPSSIQIGPTRYTVQSDEIASLTAKTRQQRNDCVGYVDHTHQRIFIDPNQGPDQLADTILHEVLHSVFVLAALQHGPAGEHEELIISALSSILLDTLRRNPELVAYLTTMV